MKEMRRWAVYITIVLTALVFTAGGVYAGPLEVTSSTQLLFGDDLLGESQSIVAQYMRFSFRPEGKKFSAAGFGRIWGDLSGGKVRDKDFNGRLYYLYLDYTPIEQLSMRLGRQFVNLSAGSSLMDGATLNVNKIGPLGLTVTAGRDIVYSLDSELSREGNYFVGMDVHLNDVKNTQLGVSYVRKYDSSDLSREEFGLNARYIYKWISPYAEIKYDRLSKAVDEAQVGINLFPVSNLMLKAEYYQSYPTFDSTSIFSVFAVDRFREGLLRAEYSLPKLPVSIFGEYKRQSYEDSSNADVFVLGARVFPTDRLTVSASVDYRHSYEDRDFGFELLGDYKLSKKIALAAGVQHNAYQRPDDIGTRSAQRYWFAGKWTATKNLTVTGRLEDNANETFSHRTLGRMTLDWNL